MPHEGSLALTAVWEAVVHPLVKSAVRYSIHVGIVTYPLMEYSPVAALVAYAEYESEPHETERS